MLADLMLPVLTDQQDWEAENLAKGLLTRLETSAQLAASFRAAQSLDAVVVLYSPAWPGARGSLNDGIRFH